MSRLPVCLRRSAIRFPANAILSSNNSPPPLIVTMTPLGYIERLVPRELDIFQRSMELWPKLFSVFPCALTLYHIYMYNQQNPLRWSAHAPHIGKYLSGYPILAVI